MTEAIVSIAVESLGDLLIEEAKFLSGVTDQVEEISRELRRMRCFLRDADTRGYKDEAVQNWLREIKSLTYRVEDAVETYAVEVASKRGKGVKEVLTRFPREDRSLHKIGLEIAQIETDISQLTRSLESHGIKADISVGESSGAADANQRWARQTYAHEVEEYFVGMEEDIEKLVSLVVDDQRYQPKISVWGMGGLGKTTIARKIYKHRVVQQCFEHFAWVCITQQGQIRGILQDILTQFFPEKDEVKYMEVRELVQELYRVQIENKCLVVLDDIWYMHDWQTLIPAFPAAESSSKILLTTRTKEVAEIGLLYELRFLNDEESWELLKNIALSKKNVEVLKANLVDLEHVGIKMVRKCGGLPLAITVLGRILKDKYTMREWQFVNKNIDFYLSKGEGSEERSYGGTLDRILSLSYDALPYHLKPCFLYLGNFREDEEIDVEELYLLWMAEGMILSKHRRIGETLREVAERYLNELGQRSMVQLQMNDFSIYRKFKSCRLQNTMRGFCLYKGREEGFAGVIDLHGFNKPSLDSFSRVANAAYRLVIHTSDKVEIEAPVDLASVLEDCKQLRSLLFRNVRDRRNNILWPISMVNYENLEKLRVLKFEKFNFRGQKLPAGLEKLMHLRLLSFYGCHFDVGILPLSSSVFNLPFLQTLDLRTTDKINIPNVLGKMKRLRHLYLHRFKGDEKLRLHDLSELETLDGFVSSKLKVADLIELVNLRFLHATVTDNESLCDIVEYLMSKNGENLKETYLTIKYTDSFSSEEGSILLRKILACGKLHKLDIEGVKISKFPSHEEHFLPSLVSLSLWTTKIDEDPMETLEKLPQLRSLKLRYNSYMGKDLICHRTGFRELRNLDLSDLPNLCGWKVEEGGMPNLSRLQINDCPVLEMIPDGLKYTAGLQELIIQWMPATFAKRIKSVNGQEGDDFDKIRHVPSITIRHCDWQR